MSFCQEKGGIASPEALSLLAGTTSISLGIAEDTLRRLASSIREDNIDPNFFINMKKEDILSEIIRISNSNTKKELNNYFNLVGNRLITGYDVTDKVGNDMPDVLVDNILLHLNGNINTSNNEFDIENEKRHNRLLSKIPSEHHIEFNELLNEARLLNRLRDERSLYTDVLATGLARRALKHAGERLYKIGKIENPSLALYATNEEVCDLLAGRNTILSSTLIERRDWCTSQCIENAPIMLGEEDNIYYGQGRIENLPKAARLSLSAISIVLKEVYEESTFVEDGSKLTGSPVSPGIYEGIARIINSVEDFGKIQKGDVLVTRSTTASYNVILPLLGAIVTDRGGQLSHAAIVAREFGIPSVVGTRDATQVIEDGCRIRVDGSNGTVEKII
ncbi:PEP-utilizing enzyme [Xenorhabdus sp. SF857]|uniref:PEP-utilizing enzyme n=1 Tax=Xenorhabdus bakwenae TaxID=3026967 RepID=UPI002557EDDF|nr:PEP-utilizing enzyme [Xenorhabdus sp. SF857]WFQ79797.1 PEP-utilizing enzyme [Xenorhabdus sp. SF857]